MELNKPFRARIAGADFSPAHDDNSEFVFMLLAVPKDTRIGSGVVEVTLLERGGIDRDMLDTQTSNQGSETDGR